LCEDEEVGSGGGKEERRERFVCDLAIIRDRR
jgi:hypothetical protein